MAQFCKSQNDQAPTFTMPQVALDAHEGEEDNGDIPSAFHPDMTMREMKASFKSNKGALTRLSR